MKALYGVDSMPETGENVAADFNISRADQDPSPSARNSVPRARRTPGCSPSNRARDRPSGERCLAHVVERDEQLRPDTTLEGLAKLKPVVRAGAGHRRKCIGNQRWCRGRAIGVRCGCREIPGLKARARVLGFASAEVAPAHHGSGSDPGG